MFRKPWTIPLLLLTACLLHAPSEAQQQTARVVELRVVALSRGYMRPLRTTAERIAKVEGIESCRMVGYAGDTARFSVSTRLENEKLAAALQLNILGSGTGFVTLGVGDDDRARRAEARGVLMQIALAISELPKPGAEGEDGPLFATEDSLSEKMERLGLDPGLLNGTHYTPEDYHIEEMWDFDEGEYRIWAGDSFEIARDPDEGYWDDEDTGRMPASDPRFVGVRVYRSAWSNSMRWLDTEGLRLEGYAGSRSETDSNGKLYVQQGASWMRDVASAAVARYVNNPKQSIASLPQGGGWGILDSLEDRELERWDMNHYDVYTLRMNWRDEDDRRYATLTAHHDAHPFYLKLEVDASAVLTDYQARAVEQGINLKELQRVELGDALTWIFGPESSVEVFREREREAADNFRLIREALKQAAGKHPLHELCGRLDDEGLRTRLGAELTFERFRAEDYRISPQMLGDVELTVGTDLTGGRHWALVNAAGGNVIRSNR